MESRKQREKIERTKIKNIFIRPKFIQTMQILTLFYTITLAIILAKLKDRLKTNPFSIL